MTQTEYEQKRRECWEEFKVLNSTILETTKQAFDWIWNCAYALGKQEKDAEETPISERLYEEEKSQLEGLYYYLNRAADKQENESVSVATLFEAMERLEDMFGIDLLTNGHGKPTEKDADTVIQGWVGRDQDGYISLFKDKPTRDTFDKGDVPYGFWDEANSNHLELPITSFPDLTWESDPQPVEIIIKRKKQNL